MRLYVFGIIMFIDFLPVLPLLWEVVRVVPRYCLFVVRYYLNKVTCLVDGRRKTLSSSMIRYKFKQKKEKKRKRKKENRRGMVFEHVFKKSRPGGRKTSYKNERRRKKRRLNKRYFNVVKRDTKTADKCMHVLEDRVKYGSLEQRRSTSNFRRSEGTKKEKKRRFFWFSNDNTPAFHSKFVQVKPPFLENNEKCTHVSFTEEIVPTRKTNIPGFRFGKRAHSIYFFYTNYWYKMSPRTGVIAPAAVVVVRIPSCDYSPPFPIQGAVGRIDEWGDHCSGGEYYE